MAKMALIAMKYDKNICELILANCGMSAAVFNFQLKCKKITCKSPQTSANRGLTSLLGYDTIVIPLKGLFFYVQIQSVSFHEGGKKFRYNQEVPK